MERWRGLIPASVPGEPDYFLLKLHRVIGGLVGFTLKRSGATT